MPRKLQKECNKDPVLAREIPLSPQTFFELDLFHIGWPLIYACCGCYIKISSGQNPQQWDIQIWLLMH